MFDLVFQHQRPRILCYLGWLKSAYQAKEHPKCNPEAAGGSLSVSLLTSRPIIKNRMWTDNKGLDFAIPVNLATHGDNASPSNATEASFNDVETSITDLFEKVRKLCADEPQATQDLLLKQVMHSMYDLWRGARSRSGVKAHLHRHFGESRKQRREVEKSLLFLCKTYAAVHSFIEAAERLPACNSICVFPIDYHNSGTQDHLKYRQLKPIEVAHHLGIAVQQPRWIGHLEQEEAKFATLLKEQRHKFHVHAEIQVLLHHALSSSPGEKKDAHPYIGCSRRCCWLCHFVIHEYGGFEVRGTHETVIHRWEIPREIADNQACSEQKLQSVIERLLQEVKIHLQSILGSSFPGRKLQLLAQSSVALSSGRSMVEEESALLEKSHRELQ